LHEDSFVQNNMAHLVLLSLFNGQQPLLSMIWMLKVLLRGSWYMLCLPYLTFLFCIC